MSDQEDITAKELKKLSQAVGIGEDVIKASGLPGTRLKELFDVHSGYNSYRNKLVAFMTGGGIIVPCVMAIMALHKSGPQGLGGNLMTAAVGLQLLTLAVTIGSMTKYAHQHRNDPNVRQEIEQARDSRLIALDAKDRGQQAVPSV